LHAELPTLLRQLEEQGIREVGDGPEHRGGFDAAANSLGITSLLQLDTAYPGSIYPTIALSAEKSGGAVAQTGDALASWLGDWIAQSEQAHNLDKVVSSGAGERHMFLILPGFAEAPFGVVDLLMRDEAPLPTIPPTLPPEVTHVWAVSTWSTGDGMRFSPDIGWQRFDKRVNQGASGGKDATAGRSWS
jgi:hypothetical protein